MNKRLKSIVAVTVVTMIVSQSFIFSNKNLVKAASINVQVTNSSAISSSMGGFELEEKKPLKDLKCNAYIYKHKKTGARLIFIDNKDENKTFCINFRTPTKDNTGVNHIIEHTVLEGSQNYPVKNLFIEIGKQTLSTFINAFTTTDSTIYPVASKNDKDFQNLMAMYLDSVFYPNVLKDKKIFEQEGWRYELDSPQGELKYNGIVYNEMKGNYSNPEWVRMKAIADSLFKDSSYKFESGGLPEEIPNLTYEEFLKTYNEYYTPSNSYLYLSGNLDIEKTLKFIGDKYLNNFDKKETKTQIEIQKPFTERKIKIAEYSLPKGTPIENKSTLSSNYVVDKVTNKEVTTAFFLLQSLLAGTPSSPLSKALKDNGFGENIKAEFNIQYLQPTFSIIAQNVNEKEKDKFQKVVDDTLKNVVKNGFDKELLNSALNSYELSSRAVKGNAGYMYDMAVMKSWLYDGDPTAYLDFESDMLKIRSKAKDGYLESLIQKYLLDNNHASLVVLKPVEGLEEKKEVELKTKLSKYKESLSKEQINELIKKTKELKVWQDTPNSKEALNKLPKLSLKDINSKVKEYKTVEKNENDVKVLYHPIFTNGVGNTTLYFDSSKVPQEKLGYLYLLRSVLTNIDTENYTKEKLSQEIEANSSGLNIYNICYAKDSDSNEYYPKMQVSFSALNDKIDKNFEVINEIIYKSNLNDKKRLKEIISNKKKNLEAALLSNNSYMAVQKVNAYMCDSGKYIDFQNEQLYLFLCDLDKNFDSKSDEIVKNLKEVRNLIFNKQDMMASYIGEEENYKHFAEGFNKFSSKLKNEKLTSYKYKFDSSNRNEGIMVPSKVQYVAKGGDISKAGYTSDGKLLVLQHILQNDYLVNNIRVKGGAYGSGMTVGGNGVIFSSYRDPNLKETIDTFNKIPEYLRNFKADEEQMTNYIIGAIGTFDNSGDGLKDLIGPAADGMLADQNYITGVKKEDLEKKKQQIVSTKAEDIRNFAEVMDAVLKQNYLCVIGGDTKIKENKKNFMAIKDVLNSKEEKIKMIEMEKKENVDSNKVWTVKFSKDLDNLTVNTSNVYVLDEQNHEIKIKVSYDKDTKNIKIEPINSYEKGKKYTLFLKDIQSIKDKGNTVKLFAPIKMDFVIKN